MTRSELVKSHIPRRFGLDPIRGIQVLCPMNRSGVGARSLNIELQAALRPTFRAAVAALSLGVSAAYAAGGPVGYQPLVYGSQAFTDHSNDVATQFFGPNTVLGKLFNHSNGNQVAATSSTKE